MPHIKGPRLTQCAEVNLDLQEIVNPASKDTDHEDISDGVGLVLSTASYNFLAKANPVLVKNLDLCLQPTRFGIAVSGCVLYL